MINKLHLYSSGQTLVLLLIYMVVVIIITSAAVAISLSNSQATNKVYQGNKALEVAETGIETAMIKLLRDPNYTGEILTVGDETVTITISGTNPKVVESVGVANNFTRTVETIVDTTDNVLTVVSWKEK
jgi:hypothetical protein